MQALPQQVANAKENAPFFAAWLKDVDPASVTSRAALAKLPVLRKAMLGEVQKKQPPMGGLITVPMSKVRHVFMSPGPIFEIDTDEPDYFRGARAMYAGGFRPGDVVYNTFSYHLTPAGIMMESALRALGCAVVPGGVGNTELQLDAIAAIRPTGYVGTPSFLKILIEKARRARQGHLLDQEGLRRRRGAAAVAAPDVHRQGHDLPAELRHGRPRHHRLRIRRRSRA